MKGTALALLGVNIILALVLAFSDGPEPPRTAFPESDAPPVRLLSELEPPEPPAAETAPPQGAADALAALLEETPTAPGEAAEHPPEIHTEPASPEHAAAAEHTATTDHAMQEEHTATTDHASQAEHGKAPAPGEHAPHAPETPPAQAHAAHPAPAQDSAPVAALDTPPPEPAPPAPKPKPLHDYCYRLGPIYGKTNLATVRTRLQRHLGVRGRTEAQKVPVRVGYWVFIPPQPLPQAEKTLRQLRRKGIEDLYLLRDGDYRGAISLGLYKQRRFAEKRQKALAARGIETQLEARYKPGHRYWIEVRYRGERPPAAERWRAIEKGLEGLGHRRVDCA